MGKKYTREEVVKATLEYFDGDQFQTDVFVNKYALRDREGNYYELTPKDMHRRLAREFARIEAKYPNPMSEDEIFMFLDRFAYIVPQGSPMFGIGNDYQTVSVSNCAVLPGPEDTMSSIFDRSRDMANLYKRRFGVGIDISHLRPGGASVSNAAITSTGAWSFADFYSYVTRMVGQCIAEGQRVLTLRGMIPIEQVRPGEDEVWTRIGWVRVNHLYRNGKKPVYRMTTEHGYSVVATEDHIFSSETGEKTMKEIGVGGNVNILLGTKEWSKPLVRLTPKNYERSSYNNSNRLKEITQPPVLDEELAYLIGYTYGNGYVEPSPQGDDACLSIAVPHKYPKIKQAVIEVIKSKFGIEPGDKPGDGAVDNVTLRSKHVIQFLALNDLLKTKAHDILYPEPVKASPIPVQMAFIAGFFDADGYVSGRKKGFALASVSQEFLREIQTVLAAVGAVTRLHAEDRSAKGWQTLYTLTVTGRISKRRFKALIAEYSVKASSATESDLGNRDENLTPWTASDLGVNYNHYDYVPGRSQLSLNAVERLRQEGDDVATLVPAGTLVQSRVDSIEYVGEVPTYDLGLAEEHLFWCEGVYSHNSGRRGALMITIDVRHPDIEKFITMKSDLMKVTGANVSVRVTDDFMEAVENDADWELRWPVNSDDPKVRRTVRARDIFNLAVEMATTTAEPGFLFWDTIKKNLPLDKYPGFETVSTNPCVSGDTQILTVDGPRTFKELADEGEDVLVYAVNRDTNEAAVRWMRNPRKTRENVEVLEVEFDSGLKVRATPDHNFIDIRGRKVQAKDLKVGQSISAFHLGATRDEEYRQKIRDGVLAYYAEHGTEHLTSGTNHKVVAVRPAGTEDVYNGTVDEVHTYIIVDPESIHHASVYTGIVSANCGEIPLSPYDSCRLISIYLPNLVKDEFDPQYARIDWDVFEEVIRVATRLSDDLVDLEIEKLQQIREQADTDDEREMIDNFIRACVNGRRTGLGTHGLADMLARRCLRYDSDEGIDYIYDVYRVLCVNAYRASVELAKERGAFPAWDWEIEKSCEFFKNLPEDLIEEMKVYGRRNGALLTNAPTGSTSALSNNCSSGIEPVFQNVYTRRRKVDPERENVTPDFIDPTGDAWVEYKVYHKNVQRYLDKYGLGEDAPLPDYFVTADQIDWMQRVRVQGTIQKWIDHSISSTINLPAETTPDVVAQLYLEAWKSGCKGVTVYRDGSRPAQVLSTESSAKDAVVEKVEKFSLTEKDRPLQITYRPTETHGPIHKASFVDARNRERKVYVIRGHNDEGDLVETFLIDEFGGPECHAYAAALGRVVSLALKHGVPVDQISKKLVGIAGGSQSFSEGDHFISVPDMLGKLMLRTPKYTSAEDTSEPILITGADDDSCPECFTNLTYTENCLKCLSCGWSQCG